MGGPFTDCGAAFAPMMTDTVGLSGVRKGGAKVATSFCGCVFHAADDVPLAESDVSTDVKCVSVVAPVADFAGVVPQVGDALTLDDGTRWLISRVETQIGNYNITARSEEKR